MGWGLPGAKETKEILAADLQAALERSGEAARAELERVDVVLVRFQLQRSSVASASGLSANGS